MPLIVDNTAAPLIARPFDHGAAIVVYSTTKYIGGHGTSIGGMIVDGGNFDWEACPERQPLLNTPDPSYHGAIWIGGGQAARPDRLYPARAHRAAARSGRGAVAVQRLPDAAGARDAAAAHAAPLRECADGRAIPRKARTDVTKVIHPVAAGGRPARSAPTNICTRRSGRPGRLRARGRERGGPPLHRRAQALYHVANIGDARSLAIHPASTTHSQLSADEQIATGVSPGYVRLSIGLEHIDDIIADLDQALAAAS